MHVHVREVCTGYRGVIVLKRCVHIIEVGSCYRGAFILKKVVFIVGWRRSSGSWSNKRRSATYARETFSVSG